MLGPDQMCSMPQGIGLSHHEEYHPAKIYSSIRDDSGNNCMRLIVKIGKEGEHDDIVQIGGRDLGEVRRQEKKGIKKPEHESCHKNHCRFASVNLHMVSKTLELNIDNEAKR